MKVTLKVDSEMVPIIARAVAEYMGRSLTEMVVAPTPVAKPVVAKPAKKRGRPRGSTNKKVAAVAAPVAQAA